MKFCLGPIPDSGERRRDPGWRRLPELSPWVILASMIGVAIALVLVVERFWRLRLGPVGSDFLPLAWAFSVMISSHECLHACVLPGFPRSDRISMGLWLARGFFVQYQGEMSRERWLAAAALPLVVLTGGPILLALGWGIQSRFWADVSTWNAAAACADIVYFLLVLAEVPPGAIIVSQGARTSWRA